MAIDLSRAEKIALLRRCANRLQVDSDPAARWVGLTISDALRKGHSLDDALGVRPPKGSRATAQALLERESIDKDLAQLANALGLTVAASVLRGECEAPPVLTEIVDRLRESGAGLSSSAISRACSRARHST